MVMMMMMKMVMMIMLVMIKHIWIVRVKLIEHLLASYGSAHRVSNSASTSTRGTYAVVKKRDAAKSCLNLDCRKCGNACTFGTASVLATREQLTSWT